MFDLRRSIYIGLGIALIGWQARAQPLPENPYSTMNIKGEKREFSQEQKDCYLSTGKDYLRKLIREQVMRFVADRGLYREANAEEKAASLDILSLAGSGAYWPETRLRVMANEDVEKYLSCGRFIPIKFELESNIQVTAAYSLRARLHAPLNDLLRLELGSSFSLFRNLSTTFQYSLQNGSQIFSGLTVGMGMDLSPWHLQWDCDINPDAANLQRLSLARFF